MKRIIAAGIMAGVFAATAAFAAPKDVTVAIKTEKQETIVKNGKKLTQVVPATKFAPGDVIIYTITYANKGKEPAVNAVVDDPIPSGTTYVGDSAAGAGADITFSIDGGKTFKKSGDLTYKVSGKNEVKKASPKMYTTIRWTIAQIPAGGSGKVSFKARVK